jgi:hypothetical protein
VRAAAFKGLAERSLEAFGELVRGLPVCVLFRGDDVELFEGRYSLVFLPRSYVRNVVSLEELVAYLFASGLNQALRSAAGIGPGK